MGDFFAKLEKDGGYEYDGCWHESAESVIQVGLLGFCGCGNPDVNLAYILVGLELIDEKCPDAFKDREAWNVWYTDHTARERAHFGSDAARNFFYYWCDERRLTEHGGSIPGWLDEKGRELLAALSEWAAMFAEDEA